jgi:hypothetical protein
VRDYSGLAAQSGEGKRGKRRGDWGLFIGVGLELEMAGGKWIL